MTCLSGYVAGAADFRGEQYTASDGALVRLGGVTLILCTRQHAKRLVVEVRRAEDCRIRGAGPVRVGWDERQAARSKKYLRRGQRQKQPRREASRSSAAGHRSLCTVPPWHTHRPSSDLDCSHRPKPHEPLLHIPAVHPSCWHNAVSGGDRTMQHAAGIGSCLALTHLLAPTRQQLRVLGRTAAIAPEPTRLAA